MRLGYPHLDPPYIYKYHQQILILEILRNLDRNQEILARKAPNPSLYPTSPGHKEASLETLRPVESGGRALRSGIPIDITIGWASDVRFKPPKGWMKPYK